MSHRYLVVTELFLPTKGGTAVWFDEVYRRLGGKEIHIITADVPGADEHDASHPNSIHRVLLKRYGWLRPESLGMYMKLLLKSLEQAFKIRFDAVHAGRVLPEGLVAWIVAKLIRRPLVVYAHGEEITTWRQPGKIKVMRFTYQHADRVIANSEFTRDELLKLGVNAERISIIYPGVDITRFRPGLETRDLRLSLSITDDQRLILSVGRLSRRKGFDQVIRSLSILSRNGIDAHYAIVGIGEDHDYLQSLARELDVSSRLHLLGHIASNDLPRWYNAADVFAMPNRDINGDNEGFGMVFLEAAACGKPVLAGKDGGTAAAVLDGVTGLRVNGSPTDEVARGLVRLLRDAEFAEQLATKAYSRAVAEFSWERVAEKTLAVARHC
ncbi:MAG: glycosyltransferase family 4 protein [Burkholderiales bacterium]